MPDKQIHEAVSEAIAAVIAKSDSLTMRFGDYEQYAELQDYTVSLATLFGVAPSPQMIMALYKCGCLYAMIYGRQAKSSLDDLRSNQISPHYVTNVDKPKPFLPSERTKTSSYVTPPETKEKEGGELLYSKLRSMMLDADSAEELEQEIEQFCTQLYNKYGDKSGH